MIMQHVLGTTVQFIRKTGVWHEDEAIGFDSCLSFFASPAFVLMEKMREL
jgi:hypothetical protein